MRRLVGIGRPGDGGDDRHVPADDHHHADHHDDVGRHVDDVDHTGDDVIGRLDQHGRPDRGFGADDDRPGPPDAGPTAGRSRTRPIRSIRRGPTRRPASCNRSPTAPTGRRLVGHGGDSGLQFVTFKLTQAFFGEACTAQFGADGCDNDVGTLEEPSGTMPMFVSAGLLTVADPTTQQSYVISGDMLVGLLSDPTGAGTLVPGYVYVPFPYLLHVTGGQIVSAEQVWTP